MRLLAINYEFVEFIPSRIEDGVLYIALEYSTATHSCCCGCGLEVVTPLSPTDWQLSFDGRTVSLYPSIGNWNYPCQSHYWIKNGKVQWAEPWSKERIAQGRVIDKVRKSKYYAAGMGAKAAEKQPDQQSWWRRLLGRLFG